VNLGWKGEPGYSRAIEEWLHDFKEMKKLEPDRCWHDLLRTICDPMAGTGGLLFNAGSSYGSLL
jgi:hypothetical protein